MNSLDILDSPEQRAILREQVSSFEKSIKSIPAHKWIDLGDLSMKLTRQGKVKVKIVNEKQFPSLNGREGFAFKILPKGLIMIKSEGKEFIAHIKSLIWV